MATNRSYGECCAAAHALDLVGERWALLIVRELLLGPKRFTDLRSGLAHASPNVLAQRLRELEQDGVIVRRKLGPPFGTWVYDLTDWGRELESVIAALGRWGARSPTLPPDAAMSPDSVVLAVRALFDPRVAGDLHATYELRLDDDRLTIAVAAGGIEITRGDADSPDAVIATDPITLRDLISGRSTLAAAQKRGKLAVTGDATLVTRLFESLSPPAPVTAR